MFKKPVRIKSNNQVKGSERKSIKDLFEKSFPNVPKNDINNYLNNKKDTLNVVKVVTHTNEVIQVYLLQKQPILFTIKDSIYPTVFLLWKFPELLQSFTVHPQVMNFISSGADLMLPGVVTPPAPLNKYGNGIQEGDPVYVNTSDNKAAVAVGVAHQSSFDMERSNGRGKCVVIHHYYGDYLCTLDGGSWTAPNLGPPEWLIKSDVYEEEFPALGESETKQEESAAQQENDNVSEDEELDMDELLMHTFLASIKYSKSLILPVLISNFFRVQMLPISPELDLKKTSFKKLKPFLDEMAQQELITIKEIKKGVEAITDINRTHPKFNEFYLKPEDRPKTIDEPLNTPSTKVTESYVITANVAPLFQEANYRKGDILDGPNIRKLVTEYVKQNNCQLEDNSKLIRPNTPALKTVCKTENPLAWEELFEKVLQSMKACFCVNSTVNKGKITPITMTVSVRSGNKKVTLIDNLEAFGVNVKEFAKECQHGVAASTSILPAGPGKKYEQLLVQGNQVIFVHNLLVEKYGISKKYIRGLELAPKGKKKK
ncbi:hypothetical protein ABEB36_011843 [Hypothenemus hampei]|uniref:SUI1 domain-containing protein n=1 Tax=Hypothenemus hampei TaxID=57062 RepID=A0ABD1E9G1_HYPHA